MSDLIPRPKEAIRRGSDPLAPTLPQKVQKAVDRESAYGLVNAARAQAVGYVTAARLDAAELVTERAMISLDRLNRVEAATAKTDPIKAERFAGLVDDFVMIARNELRNLTREF